MPLRVDQIGSQSGLQFKLIPVSNTKKWHQLLTCFTEIHVTGRVAVLLLESRECILEKLCFLVVIVLESREQVIRNGTLALVLKCSFLVLS